MRTVQTFHNHMELTKRSGDTDLMRRKGILERKSQAMDEIGCYHF